MSHMASIPGEFPQCLAFRSASRLAAASVALISSLWFLAGAHQAQGMDFMSASDINLSLSARTAIAEDFRFFFLNLGVPVRDGIATVWGPVPSEESATQILEVIGKIKGIKGVHNDMVVLPEQDWPQEWRRTRPLLRPLDQVTLPQPEVAVSLRPPLALDESSDAGNSAFLQSLSPFARGQFASQEHKPDLSDDLRAIKESDARFARIDVVLQDHIVYIRGQGAILFTIAERVAVLSGVDRVVIQTTR